MRTKFSLAAIAVLLIIAQVRAQGNDPVMANSDVIKLVRSGLDKDIILTTIESATGKYDVTPDGLVKLKTEGVPASVIKAMIASMQQNKTQKARSGGTSISKSRSSDGGGIPEPEVINAIYAYDKPTRTLKPLEKNNATQKGRKANPFGGATSYTCEIPGDKSVIRLAPDQPVSFVVNTGGVSPDAIILYKVETKKGRRSATTSKITGLGSMKGAQGTVACDLKSLKPGIYEIAPSGKLEPGEYFFTTKQLDFTTMANMDVYAFGID